MLHRTSIILMALAVFLLPGALARAAGGVQVELDQTELHVGEPTQLTVTVSGEALANAEPVVPASDGLSIQRVGSSQQIAMVNGQISRNTSYLYRAIPTRAGELSIGPVRVGDQSAAKLHVKVLDGPADPRGASRSSTRAAPQSPFASLLPGFPFPPWGAAAPAAPDDSAQRVPEPPGRRAFVKVEIPKKKLIVGESVPITVRAFVKAGTAGAITGAPELSSDAFAVRDLVSDPQQGETTIHGTPYATLTWRGKLTGVLPGDHRVKLTLPATLKWQDVLSMQDAAAQDPMNDMFDSFFDDPAFAGMPSALRSMLQARGFGSGFATRLGAPHSADVTLEDALGTLHVVEPPRQGRPEGFDGAIGRFTLEAQLSPREPHVGEPVTLTLHVRGQGAFERVEHALLGDGDADFRAYPVSSEMHKTPRGEEKVFKQTLVPKRAGELSVGPLALAFYDPARAAYATETSARLRLHVLPAEDDVVQGADEAAGGVEREGLSSAVARAPGRFVTRLLPAPHGLWPLISLSLVMALSFGGALWASRRTSSPGLFAGQRKRAALRARLRTLRRAAAENDATMFFAVARCAIQERFGERLGVAPESVTLSELETRLGDVPDVLRSVLERADAQRFAGERPQAHDLDAVLSALIPVLKQEIER